MTEPDAAAGAAPAATHGARRLSPLTPVVRAPIVVLAALGGSWRSLTTDPTLVSLVVVGGLLVAGAVFGWASWLRTTYWIHDDELRIDTGVISRQSRRIRIDRLQAIDVVQPFVARLFGLAELHFDTASGSRRDGSLAFLPRPEAEELRALLLRRRDAVRGHEGVGAQAGEAQAVGAQDATLGPLGADPAPAAPAPAPPARVLARLDLRLLLLSTLLSSATLVFLGGGLVLLATSMLTGAPLFAGGLVPALIGLGIAAFRNFSSAYGFVVSESPEGLSVRRGLTALTSQTVPLARVQGVVVSEPLLWRRFGWARLEVSVAGADSGADETFSASTLLPVGPRMQVLWLAGHVLGDEDPTRVALLPPPRRSRWTSPLSWWTLAAGHDERFVVSRRGWWTRRFDVVPLGKVQSVQVVQGPWQRRLRLADVQVDSPVGRVAVRATDRDEPDARRLTEQVVELSRRARSAGAATGP